MGKVKSQKQSERGRQTYKGKAPIKHDRFIRWFLKMLLQVVLFFLIYGWTITRLRQQWGDGLKIRIIYEISINEVFYVIFLLIVTDLLANLAALIIIIIYDYKREYIMNKKNKKQMARKGWEYFFYVVFRAIYFIIGLVWILTYLLYPTMVGAAFFTAWILCSILAKLPSKLIAIKMTI